MELSGYIKGQNNLVGHITSKGVAFKNCKDITISIDDTAVKISEPLQKGYHLPRFYGCENIVADFSVSDQRYGLKITTINNVGIKVDTNSENIVLKSFKIEGSYGDQQSDTEHPAGVFLKNNPINNNTPVTVDYYIVDKFHIRNVGKEGIYCGTSSSNFSRTKYVKINNFYIFNTGWDGAPQVKNADHVLISNGLAINMGVDQAKKSQCYGFNLERNAKVEIKNMFLMYGTHKILHSKSWFDDETKKICLWQYVTISNSTFLRFSKGFYANRSTVIFKDGVRVLGVASDLFDDHEGTFVIMPGGLILDHSLKPLFDKSIEDGVNIVGAENVIFDNLPMPLLDYTSEFDEYSLTGFYKDLGQGQEI